MKNYISWSGGKDSTATIILCYEKGIHIDGVIMSEVMFSHEKQISGENPEHIKFIYETAIPIIQNKFNFNVVIVRDKEDYLSIFNHRIKKSSVPERIGKKAGWPIGGHCVVNKLKMHPLLNYFKQQGEHCQIVGIAADEPNRLKRLNNKKNRFSILEQNNICEKECFSICNRYSLLSPIYEFRSRGGCWFCPNARIKDYVQIAKNYPQLWGELERLAEDKEIVTDVFKYNRSFKSVNREVLLLKNQISFFD